MASTRHNRSLIAAHRLALATVGATMLLIFVGGVVTNTGSALAVPDWPTTFGYSMFTYPWSKMVGGVLYEHSHRLLGSVVGILTVSLALWLALADSRRWMRWLGLIAVVAVVVQGILGGMRVLMLESGFALVHACLAHAFLSLMVALTVFTSSNWMQSERVGGVDASRLATRAVITAVLLYLQIVLGAMLMHAGTSIEIHLAGAALAALAVVVLAGTVLSERTEQAWIRSPTLLLLGLLTLQFVLGTGAYLARFTDLDGASALVLLALPITHRIVGAAMLATAVVIALRALRLAAMPSARRLPSLAAAQEKGGIPA
jgi:cytochrome c oxidase assembly protein subunit 15